MCIMPTGRAAPWPLQNRCVEVLSEPAVDAREKIASLGALALVAPEAGETVGGRQIRELGALLLRHCNWVAIVLLRRDAICGSQRHPRN
jgi:hypothetical protein